MAKTIFHTSIEILINGNPFEIDVTVTGEYSPFERGVRGDHGEPLEPDYEASFDIETIFDENSGIEYFKDQIDQKTWESLQDEGVEAAQGVDHYFED